MNLEYPETFFYCEFCRTKYTAGDGGCDCFFCESCEDRHSEDEIGDDGLCETCRKKKYEEEHGCMSCGDIYEGRLIYVGNNRAGVAQLYCPSCSASDIANELGMMEEATDPTDREGHRLCAMEIIKRLVTELDRGHNEN